MINMNIHNIHRSKLSESILSNDQEARPADKAVGPDSGQSAANTEEGLQLQVVFIGDYFQDTLRHSN